MSVYAWGFGKLGQLGNGQTDTVHTPIQPKLRKPAVQINSGGYFTAIISNCGELWTFGCGKYGRLGTGSETDSPEPVKIKCVDNSGNVKLKLVSCGNWHGAAISENNDLYVWGYGQCHCVLGSHEIPHMSPPSPLYGPFRTKVSGVTCGNNFTLVWTLDGDAYSWGCGRHGVLGHGDESDRESPTFITKFNEDNVKVTFMDAGFVHCGAITSDGQVYMFGRGEDWALGLGTKKTKAVTIPTVVESLNGKDIVELSCSVNEKHGHTLFVSRTGNVYSCGDGYKGKLGLGDQENRKLPTMIPEVNFNGEKITHVASGGIHSAAVSKEGQVFTWGCGSDGRLGHPDGKGHRYLFRSDVPRVVEDLVKLGPASDVRCSYYHTVALMKQTS